MSRIYDFTQPFNFDNVVLGTPSSRNGSYFMKLTANSDPIYVQLPKSTMKQGFIKSGKKTYCDLIFSNENEKFMSWLESLESICFNYIYGNKDRWFDTEFEKEELESMVIPLYKMYKSGKFFIVRAFVPSTLGKYDLKVYDEDENVIEVDDVPEDSNVIAILEFKGIKSALRNFQFEIEIKQMLVVKPDILFERCIIHRNGTGELSAITSREQNPQPKNESSPENNKNLVNENNLAKEEENKNNGEDDEKTGSDNENYVKEMTEIIEPSEKSILEMDMEEVVLDLAEIKDEPVSLKSRNEVYYKMYKDAKKKAREAKMLALSNYLEAKRIKDTYMLEDNSDDEDNDEDLTKIFSSS